MRFGSCFMQIDSTIMLYLLALSELNQSKLLYLFSTWTIFAIFLDHHMLDFSSRKLGLAIPSRERGLDIPSRELGLDIPSRDI